MHIEKKTLTKIFFGAVGCIILYWLLHDVERVKSVFGVIKSIVAPFALGAAFAFVINVPMRAIEGVLKGIKKDKWRRICAILLTVVAVLLVLALVFVLLIPQLTSTVQSLIPQIYDFIVNIGKNTSEFLNKNPEIMEWLAANTEFEMLDWSGLAQKVISFLGSGLSSVANGTFAAIGNITGAVMDAFIAIVFSVYCLFQKEVLARQGRKLLYAFLPEHICDHTVRILRLTNSTFSNFLSGQCVEVCILGSLFAITMAIFRMPYVPLVSVVVAVTAFIPVVGAWTGCVVGGFLILVEDPVQAIWFVLLFIVLQAVENNLIYPKVVGTSVGLSGMWVLVGIGVGGELMGVAGMFLMIPVVSVIHTLLSEVTNKRLLKRNIDPEKLTVQPPELATRLIDRFKKKK